MDTATPSRRIKRPNFSVKFKQQIVEATLVPEASAAFIAREHGVNANLLFKWRRHYQAGDYGLPDFAAAIFAAHETTAVNWMPVARPPGYDLRSRYRLLSGGMVQRVHEVTLWGLFRHASTFPQVVGVPDNLVFCGDRSTDLSDWRAERLALILLRSVFEQRQV